MTAKTPRIFKTRAELLKHAKTAENKTFEIYAKKANLMDASESDKGWFGNVIEVGLFDKPLDSKRRCDFPNLGVELKVAPLKKNKNGELAPKERISITMIDYGKEYKRDFESSDAWKKAQSLLIMFYLHEAEKARHDMMILKADLHRFSDLDKAIIKRDWEIITSAIENGKAHELSEADTLYLGAARKGAKNSVRKQPCCDVMAPTRSYSLKTAYIRGYIKNLFEDRGANRISFATAEEYKKSSFGEIIQNKLAPYFKCDADKKVAEYGINERRKDKYVLMVRNMLGIESNDLSEIEEFRKANIVFKTVRLDVNGQPKEAMQFGPVHFDTLLDGEWEDSQLYELFADTTYLFVVLQEDADGVLRLEKVKLWVMPDADLEGEVHKMWERLRKVVSEGVELVKLKNRTKNNLPKSSESPVCHIRSKGESGKDQVSIGHNKKITRQAYWLNKGYVEAIVK